MLPQFVLHLCALAKGGHITDVWLMYDRDMAAGFHRGAERVELVSKETVCPPSLPTNPERPGLVTDPPLRCLGDLFSHTGDMALQQYACVGGCT